MKYRFWRFMDNRIHNKLIWNITPKFIKHFVCDQYDKSLGIHDKNE